MKTLEGKWLVTSLEVDGNEVSPVGSLVVKGDRFESLGMGNVYEGTIITNAAKKPHTIDMVFDKGPEKGNTNRGIFEVKGETWRLCLNLTGGERPKAFSTLGGKGIALETFTRGSAGARTAAASKLKLVPAPELEGEWQMVTGINSGVPLEAAYVKEGKRIVAGNDTTVKVMGQTMMSAKFTVDRATTPMSIDYQLKDGRLQHGIYELNGGTQKVCFAAPGAERPKEFASTAGDGRTLTTWKKL